MQPMKQSPLAIATMLGALVIAAALIYHGRQLGKISLQLQAMEKQTTGLDQQLEKFSIELPALLEQAGHDAGRQAVHGIAQEVAQMPLHWIKPKLLSRTNHSSTAILTNGFLPDLGLPWVRFDIQDPIIMIEILPSLKEVPAIPWLSMDHRTPPPAETNDAVSTTPPHPVARTE